MYKQATRDEIITTIHVLWERGIEVNRAEVHQMLAQGFYRVSTNDKVEQVITDFATDDNKRTWLAFFEKTYLAGKETR